LTTSELKGRIIKQLTPGKAIVELVGEPNVQWTMVNKGHLTLLRRNDGIVGTITDVEEVRCNLCGALQQDTDG